MNAMQLMSIAEFIFFWSLSHVMQWPCLYSAFALIVSSCDACAPRKKRADTY